MSLDDAGLAAAVFDEQLRVVAANRCFAAAIGGTPDRLPGRAFCELDGDPGIAAVFRQVLESGVTHRQTLRAGSKDHRPLPGIRSCNWSLSRLGDPRQAPGSHDRLLLTLHKPVGQDLIERNLRTSAILDARLRLSELAATADVETLMQATVNHAKRLTGSTSGFFRFLDADRETLTLTSGVTHPLHSSSAPEGKGPHHPASEPGFRADCIFQRRPIIRNDDAATEDPKDLSKAGAATRREIIVPVRVDGTVVAAIGVGNKPSDYDDIDLEAVTELTRFAIELLTRQRAEQDAGQRAQEMRKLFESMTSGFALFRILRDNQGRPVNLSVLECNPAFEAITGLRRGAIVGRSGTAREHADSDPWLERFARVEASGDGACFDDFVSDLKRHYRLTAYRPESGRCAVLYDDITALRRSQASLMEAAAVVMHIRDGVMITGASGNILDVNPAFTAITGYCGDEVVGRNPRILQSGRHDSGFYEAMWSAVLGTGFWQGEIWNRRKNGEIYPEWLTITAVCNEQEVIERYIGVFTDIGRIRQAEERADYVAHHDGLTGLPNRSLLAERFPQSLQRAMRRGRKLALLILDLDLFKNINDSLGHDFGDRLLVEIARRFKDRLRAEDTLARLGGDEFGVLMEDIADPSDAAVLARGLLDAFDAPFNIGDIDDVYISASIGISVSPDDAVDQSALMRNADAAVFLAKAHGRKTFRFYTESLTTMAQERLQLESRLRKAIELDHLVLHFQPLIDIASKTIIGSEALVRWQDPENGLISPMRFIPVAEDSGLIAPLGTWVLKTACRQMKAWLDEGRDLKTIAVNLSPRQFALQDVPEVVRGVLAETGLPAGFLELEITEGILLEHGEGAIAVLNALRQIGVRLSIDDFGTGYSSLSYLKRFPIDKLKIDQSFVRDLTSDTSDAEIVTTIIAMARALRLSVLAEGVESVEQLSRLEGQGCDYYQGFLFSAPVPAAQFPLRYAVPS